ncbi:hypothetical protein HQ590_01035, partial [bacterium]|nr:hypothetical protein [bacterium]
MEVKTSPAGPTAPRRSRTTWCIALLLLAIGQVLWVGYEWGAGNQSIQIPLLKTLIEPGLYARDAMVTDTLPLYPSWFFRVLAGVVPLAAVPNVYWVLHLLTAVAVLGAVFLLGRAVADDNWTGLVAVLLLVGGHHRSLTGEEIYLRA